MRILVLLFSALGLACWGQAPHPDSGLPKSVSPPSATSAGSDVKASPQQSGPALLLLSVRDGRTKEAGRTAVRKDGKLEYPGDAAPIHDWTVFTFKVLRFDGLVPSDAYSPALYLGRTPCRVRFGAERLTCVVPRVEDLRGKAFWIGSENLLEIRSEPSPAQLDAQLENARKSGRAFEVEKAARLPSVSVGSTREFLEMPSEPTTAPQ